MLKQLRFLMFTAVMGLFLVACGEEAPEATPEQANVEQTSVASKEIADFTVEENMTEDAAIAKFGEPTFSQTREIDQLKVTHMEWATDKGTLSIQFFNGQAQYNQFTNAE